MMSNLEGGEEFQRLMRNFEGEDDFERRREILKIRRNLEGLR